MSQPGTGVLTADERRLEESRLLASIHLRMPELEALVAECEDHWGVEDGVYRFYHQSFKVFGLQAFTVRIATVLHELAPHLTLNAWFQTIAAEGTGRVFKTEDNRNWPAATRPILEAFFHARYFLVMVAKYGQRHKEPPEVLESGYAAVLELYGIR